MKRLVYLIVPYSFSPEMSFAIANEVAAELMQSGKIVFSPISQGHVISSYLDKENKDSHDFWMNMDLPILRRCDEVCAVLIGEDGRNLIRQSKGCMAELKEAEQSNMKVWYYNYEFQDTEL